MCNSREIVAFFLSLGILSIIELQRRGGFMFYAYTCSKCMQPRVQQW